MVEGFTATFTVYNLFYGLTGARRSRAADRRTDDDRDTSRHAVGRSALDAIADKALAPCVYIKK
jgi:hypothetical protein